MVVQVESTSQVDEVLRVLRRRFWWILIPTVILSTLGVAFAIIVPKKYVAETRLMVHDTRSGELGRDNTAEARVAVHTIKAPKRITAILEQLEWNEYVTLNDTQQEEYRDKIEGDLRVESPPTDRFSGQQLVRITFSHTDHRSAFEFLNALVERWKEEVLEKTRNTLREQAKKAAEAQAKQEELFTQLGDKITDLRKTHGIPPPNPKALPGELQGPAEFQQLERTKERIEELSETIEELDLEITQKQDRFERLDDVLIEALEPGEAPETPTTPLITSLEIRIQSLEEEIVSNDWLPEHSLRKRVERELAQARIELEGLRAEVPKPIQATAVEVQNQEKLDLGEELASLELRYNQAIENLATQEARRLELEAQTRQLQDAFNSINELTQQRNQAIELSRKYAEDHAELRAQMDYHIGPAGDPFSVLKEVQASKRPTEPDPLMIILIAVFGGLAIGLGLAVLTEYSKSCFRSVTDLSRVMPTPVLGSINRIVTRSQARKSAFQRLVLALGTAGFIGFFAYILWAWSYRPELLSDPMEQSIESIQEALK